MAGRVDCGDGAGARQHVFLLPGKHTRPGATSQAAPGGRARRAAGGVAPRAHPCGSHLPRGARTQSARGLRAPGSRVPDCILPANTLSFILVTRYNQLRFSKLKAGSAETDRE